MIMVEDCNTDRINQRVQELTDVLIGGGGSNADATTVMHQEVLKFQRRVINLTPTPGLGTDAKKQGEAAVKRDLNKIFTPVTDDLLNAIGSQFGVSHIDQWFTTATGEKQHIQWDRIDPSGSGMRAFHQKNRDSRGRARNLKRSRGDAWYAAYVVSFEDFAQYAKDQMARVGRRKAAWALGFKSLGGKVQRWIDRHISGAKGMVDNRLRDTVHPSVTVGSFAPGVSGDAHTIHSALRVSYEAIGKRMRLLVNGYAKDVSQGQKITKKAGSEWVTE